MDAGGASVQKERDRRKFRRYSERNPDAIKERDRKSKLKRRKYATDEERLRAHREASKRRAAERVAQQQKEWVEYSELRLGEIDRER